MGFSKKELAEKLKEEARLIGMACIEEWPEITPGRAKKACKKAYQDKDDPKVLFKDVCGSVAIDPESCKDFLVISDGTVKNTRVFCRGEFLGVFRKVRLVVDGDKAGGELELGTIIYDN